MADLMIKLSLELAQKLSRGGDISSNPIGPALAEQGARLVAPQYATGEAAQYFRVEDVASNQVEELRQSLARIDGVEAAYIKPSDELP